MSKKKSNSYTAEFKESAVKLAVESDQPVSVSSIIDGALSILNDGQHSLVAGGWLKASHR